MQLYKTDHFRHRGKRKYEENTNYQEKLEKLPVSSLTQTLGFLSFCRKRKLQKGTKGDAYTWKHTSRETVLSTWGWEGEGVW